MSARDLMQSSAISDCEVKNIILLSDGAPSEYVNPGTQPVNGGYAIPKRTTDSCKDHEGTTEVANYIRNTMDIDISSVFCGSKNDALYCCRTVKTTEYLNSISDKVIEAYQGDELLNAFEEFYQSIKTKTEAWQGTDPMGSNALLGNVLSTDVEGITTANNSLSWNLLQTEPKVTTENGKTVYVYSVTYQVKLDTLAAEFDFNKWYATNNPTKLDYYFLDENGNRGEDESIYFNIPSVQGFKGGYYELMKVDEQNNPLGGATFTLTHNCGGNCNEAWSKEYVSGNDGYVRIDNIPSGHKYKLVETDSPKGYKGDKTEHVLEVKYGVVYVDGVENKDLTVVNKPIPTTDIEGTKVWDDNNNAAGIRPPSVTVKLLANGNEYKTTTVTASDDWRFIFEDLPLYDDDGNDIDYSIEEALTNSDYVADITGDAQNGYIITNKINEKVTVSGTKTWDHDGKSNNRPNSIKLRLYKNGVEIDSKTVTGRTNNTTWEYTFGELPKYDENGVEIVYTVKEDVLDRYYATYDGYDINNTRHNSDRTSITVTKIWDDANDQDGIRPDSVRVRLYRNGSPRNSYKDLNENNNWTATFDGLDEDYTWTVQEESVPSGYDLVGITGSESKGYFITNKHTPQTTSISGSKNWEDNNNNLRPENITVNLVGKVGNNTVVEKTTTTSANKDWDWSFTNLPVNNKGNKITYTISEEPVPGYSSTVTGTTIKNEINIEEHVNHDSITWTKVAKDEEKQLTGAKFKLYSDAAKTIEVAEYTDGNFEIKTNDSVLSEYLPTTNGGSTTLYLVETDAPKGYEASETPYSVVITAAINTELNEADNKFVKTTDYAITINGEESKAIENTKKTSERRVDDSASFTKTDKEGNTLSGAEFKLKLGDTEIATYTGGEITIATDDEAIADYLPEAGGENNEVKLDLLETKAPAGYVNSKNEYEVTIKATIVEEYDETKDEYITTTTYEIAITDEKGAAVESVVNDDELISISGQKEWTDANNAYSTRPEKVTINLTGSITVDGEKEVVIERSTEVTKGSFIDSILNNDWAWSFEDLPKRYKGQEIVYTVEETAVPGYTTNIVKNDDGTYTVTNTLRTGKATVHDSVSWTKVDRDGNSLEGATFGLFTTAECTGTPFATFQDGSFTINTETLDVNKLPESEVTYYLKETAAPAGYEASDEIYDVVIKAEESKNWGTVEGIKTWITTTTYSITINGVETVEVENEIIPAEIQLGVTKQLAGRDWTDNDSFKFQLILNETPKGATSSIVGHTVATVTKDNKTAQFGKLLLDKEGVYKYTIMEKGTMPANVTKAEDQTVEVTVTKNSEGRLVAEVTKGSVNSTFKNIYTPTPANATISASKAVTPEGKFTMKAGDFEFEIAAAQNNPAGCPLAGDSDHRITVSNNADGSIPIDEWTFTKAGVYQYTMNETKSNRAGITVDDSVYTIIVTVTDDPETGELSTSVAYNKDGVSVDSIAFENVYNPKVTTANIYGYKSLDGGHKELEEGEFTFELIPLDGAPAPKNTRTTNKVSGLFQFEFEFDDATYSMPGTYKYKVVEVVDEGKDGYTYDQDEIVVTVEVTDVNGELQAVVKNAAEISFQNTYVPEETTETVTIEKSLTGREWKEDDYFKFTLSPTENTESAVEARDVVMPESNEVTITKDTEDYKAAFGDITFKKVGDYTFNVSETAGNLSGVTYDESVKTITIHVTDEGYTGKLTAVLDEDDADELKFTNTYKPEPGTLEGSANLKVSKSLIGRADDAWLETDKFKFTLTGGDEKTLAAIADNKILMPAETELTVNAETKEKAFGDIIFKEAGEYKFKITEVDSGIPGIINDTDSERIITVKVTDDTDGQLVVTVDEEDSDNLNFINQYGTDYTTLQLGVTKELSGREWKADETFEFTLSASGEQEGVTLPEDTTIEVGKNSGKVKFDAIKFEKSGTYEFIIAETGVMPNGVTVKGGAERTVIVDVVDNNDGTITALVNADSSDSTAFENEYKAGDAKVKLSGTKVLTGRDLKAGEFSFKLVGEDGKQIEIVENVKNGSFEFSELTFNEVGTYKYSISEVVGDAEGVVYDNDVHEVTVTVEDDGNGKLVATADKEAGDIVFNNVYTIDVEGVKTWDDNNNEYGNRPESITVNLLADGAEIAETEVTAADNWAYKFDNLPVHDNEGKEIEYTVTEDPVAGYETNIEGSNIINTTATTKVEGAKTWTDNDDKYGNRPDSITINLLADGEEIADTKVSAANNWTYKFENLPTHKDGVEVTYTVTEDIVPEYTAEVSGYDITNSLKTTQVSGSKKWNDKDNQDGIRPQSVTVNLTGTIEGAEEPVVTKSTSVTSATNWNWSFENLPKYAKGKEIVYTVTENAVTGYTPEIRKGEDNKFTITNTHEVDKTEVSGTKTWNDADNQDGKRPSSITVILQKNGTEVDRKTVTEADGWEYTFDNLDKFEKGQLINYSIAEVSVPEYNTTYNGYDITNSYTPGKTSVTVSKEWDDNNNQDGIRTNEVTVRLLANGEDTGKSITLNSGNNWSGSFTDLNLMSRASIIDYTLTEDAVAGYETEIVEVGENTNIFKITNTHTPEVKDISGIKTWDDNNNQDGKRPSKIYVNLLANGKIVDVQEVTAEDGWTWEFKDMPVKANGTEIVYTITEGISDEYYASEITGTSGIKNTHDPEKTTVKVVKSWQDADNVDGKRPASVQVQLKADGKIVDTVELNASNSWEHSFTGLDKYKDGKEIVYTVNERTVPDGYKEQITKTSDYEFSVVNIHEPETVDITGSKNWDDNKDQDGKRPETLSIKLYADGELYDEKTVTADNDWKWEFNDLPKYKTGEVGDEIHYVITEVSIDGYETTYEVSNNGLTQDVKNEHDPEELSVSVTKAWSDNTDQDGKRPDTVTVNLLADGNETDKKLVLKASEGWKGTFNNLPKYRDGGQEIVYTISEEEVEEYATVITGNAKDGFLVTNSYNPETVTIPGHKVWDDEDNRDGYRPESIIVNIWNEETKVASKEVVPDEDGNWNWDFTNLPKYQNGDEIEYYFTEEPVFGYEFSVEKNKITNTHVPETVVIKGEKSWDDNDDQDGLRPDGIIIYIMDGETIVETITATAEDNWKYESSALPKYRTGKVGEEIKYTVKEVAVDGYKAIYSENGYDVLNKHTPETIDIEGVKKWNDKDDQDGKRPEKVTVTLWANGEKIEETTVTESDEWKYAFTNLPKYEDGKEIAYKVTETAVDDYSTSYDNNTIINSYTPGQTSVTVSKIWLDEENQDGIRPAKVYAVLYADGDLKDKVELSSENGWTYTWNKLDEMAAGKAITYTVKEEMPADVKDYESAITGNADEGFIITNTHVPETVNVTGTKTWNDGNDQDGIRPEAVTVNIYAEKLFGDKLVDTITVVPDADGNWNYTSKDLPKYAAGKEIKYIVEEVPVEGYETVVSGTDIANTHVPEVIDIEGSKEWDDKNDQDGKRPDSITINLLANGVKVDSKEITETDGWDWTFKSVPKYKDGEEITYTITEIVSSDYTSTVDGYDVTNSYTPGKTSVTVTKAWDDANNQDGKRPNAIKVQLIANGVAVDGKTLELNEQNNWSANFIDLDEYENGSLVEYSVEEVNVPEGYKSVITGDAEEGYIITNSYIPETVDVAGTKTWNDEGDQDGKRPETLKITLNANGEEIDSQVISEETEWKWSFENLPKFEDGHMIVYSVSETLPEGYSETNTPEGITNSYTPEKTSVKITKYWADNSDQDGIRPESVTMELTADGKSTGRSVELNAENKWTATIDDLDKYHDGYIIEYGFREVEVEGYESYVTGSMSRGFHAINKHTPETVTVDGEKIWRDKDDQDGVRPEAITINLLADGKKIKEVTVTEESGWNWMFDNLPKYKDHGKLIKYTVVENQISNYDTTINNVKHDVTNVHIPSKTTVTVAKKWNDSNDQDGIRPDSIVVRLYADGVDTGRSLKLNDSNKWVETFNELDEYADGKKIKYTISEDVIEDYSTVITGKDTEYITVTNTHEPETIDVTGSKIWDDANDQDGIRPDSIKVNLLADGTIVDTKVVTASDNWAWTFKDVDKFNDGREITYTVKEEPIKGYKTSYVGMDIKNTHKPEVTDVKGSKAWDDADDQDGIRPDSITVKLLANGEIVDFTEVSAANNWNWEFLDVPVYVNGEKINYTVEEMEVPEGYESTVDGMTITNTHMPETIDINGSKTWNDAEDQDGVRPESITIRLLADGVEIDKRTVTAEDDWSWSFTELDKFKAGKEITYTVTEDAVDDYATDIEKHDIINTHTPGKTSVTVTKTWLDENDQDGIRPAEVKVQLYANGEADGAAIVLNEENSWTYTWTELDMNRAGKLIEYTVEEMDVPDAYESVISGDQTAGYVITNSYEPESTELTVYKNWKDKHDKYGKRPDSITVYLYADGEACQTVELTEDSNWRYTFEDLAVYENGEEIEYTVSEEPVEGYITEVDDFTITNTINPDEIDNAADTGDDSNPWAYGFTAMMAIITAAGALFLRRRES